MLQNAAVINRGDAPVTLDELRLDFRAGDALVQSNLVAGAGLDAIAARSGRLAASGMVEAFAFQFAPEKLLAGARPVGATTLAPGEALLIGARAFALQGTPVDALRLTAAGHAADGTRVEGRADLPVSHRPLANRYVFPLSGNWYIGAGASFHSHHRWVVPEEFALDIGRLGEGGTPTAAAARRTATTTTGGPRCAPPPTARWSPSSTRPSIRTSTCNAPARAPKRTRPAPSSSRRRSSPRGRGRSEATWW